MKGDLAMNKSIGLCLVAWGDRRLCRRRTIAGRFGNPFRVPILATLFLLACGSNGPAASAPDLAAGGSPGSGGATGTGGANGAGGATAAGGATTAAWRPFSDDSPWNTPIGSNPTLDPASKTLIADWETSSPYGEHLDVNIKGYSIPLFYADATTPTYSVRADVGGSGWTLDTYELLDKIDLSNFRVIQLGTLYDNGNG
jgi:hypothetical protein